MSYRDVDTLRRLLRIFPVELLYYDGGVNLVLSYCWRPERDLRLLYLYDTNPLHHDGGYKPLWMPHSVVVDGRWYYYVRCADQAALKHFQDPRWLFELSGPMPQELRGLKCAI